MNGLFQKVVPLTMAMALAMLQPAAHAAAKCKGMSKSSCTANSDCSWVAGYATKTGKEVDPYCRVKSGKKKSSKQVSEKQKREGTQSKDQEKKQSKEKKGKQSKDQDKKQSKKEKKSSQNVKEEKAKKTSKKQE